MKKVSSVAKNYASALMDSFENDYQSAVFQLEQIEETIESSSDLKLIIENPAVSEDSKFAIIDDIFKGKIDSRILNLLKLLIEKDKFNLIGEISLFCRQMANDKDNKKVVEIVSAIKLDDLNKIKICSVIESKLNCTIIPEWTVDENIIAGLIFKYDDNIVDTSIRSRLEALSKSILR